MSVFKGGASFLYDETELFHRNPKKETILPFYIIITYKTKVHGGFENDNIHNPSIGDSDILCEKALSTSRFHERLLRRLHPHFHCDLLSPFVHGRYWAWE